MNNYKVNKVALAYPNTSKKEAVSLQDFLVGR